MPLGDTARRQGDDPHATGRTDPRSWLWRELVKTVSGPPRGRGVKTVREVGLMAKDGVIAVKNELVAVLREQSHRTSALSKFIAIHSMHNSIEVVLRAIMLEYEIRAEGQLNVTFEQMLNEIDGHGPFRDSEKQLPNRQELRRLNTLRNLAQHHAHEPESASMDEWRAFSHRFLQAACAQYFSVNFDELSQVSLIKDDRLRRLISVAISRLSNGDWDGAAFLAKAVWIHAVQDLFRTVPETRAGSGRLKHLMAGLADQDLHQILREVDERIDQAEMFAVTLSSGISLTDYARVLRIAPDVAIQTSSGCPRRGHFDATSREDASWLCDHVVELIVRWQIAGYSPCVVTWPAGSDGFQKFDEFLEAAESERGKSGS